MVGVRLLSADPRPEVCRNCLLRDQRLRRQPGGHGRVRLGPPAARPRDELLELLDSCSQNYYAAVFRLKQVVVAGEWFRAGLALLGVLAVVLTVHNANG